MCMHMVSLDLRPEMMGFSSWGTNFGDNSFLHYIYFFKYFRVFFPGGSRNVGKSVMQRNRYAQIT